MTEAVLLARSTKDMQRRISGRDFVKAFHWVWKFILPVDDPDGHCRDAVLASDCSACPAIELVAYLLVRAKCWVYQSSADISSSGGPAQSLSLPVA